MQEYGACVHVMAILRRNMINQWIWRAPHWNYVWQLHLGRSSPPLEPRNQATTGVWQPLSVLSPVTLLNHFLYSQSLSKLQKKTCLQRLDLQCIRDDSNTFVLTFADVNTKLNFLAVTQYYERGIPPTPCALFTVHIYICVLSFNGVPLQHYK